MLFRQRFLDGIREGRITLAFRRWRRPSVRAGGTQLTAIGQLQIGAVERVDLEAISAEDLRRAGYSTREALEAELDRQDDGDVYRIELVGLRADPRVALRRQPPATEDETRALLAKLDRLDARADGGPWTRTVLEVLRDHPGVRAAKVCRLVGQERDRFKLNVRKLKALGLTESLEVGYRLSPRGRALLDRAHEELL